MNRVGPYIRLLAIISFAMSLGLVCLLTSSPAQAPYPSKPIQVIVTTAAGGALDLVARTTTERLSETLQQPMVIENLVRTGKARYIFHNYPFIDGSGASNGGESDQAANASMCANEQDKFWVMHSIIYANWNGENQGNLSNRRLQAMAESAGLDMSAFNSCFTANKYKSDIQADFDKGQEMGVNGTPTVFVNGTQVGQAGKIATYDDIAQAVNAIAP